ncbi:MAG: asparagine synthase-related protein [Chloroflexaceae bacterium]
MCGICGIRRSDGQAVKRAARGKQGSGVLVGQWLRADLRPWARERLETRALRAWLRPAAVQALFAEHLSKRTNHGKKLRALLMPGVWQEQAGGV